MEVILLEAINKLGNLGDTVKVKPGYARNYLLPQKKAVRVTAESIAEVENRRAQLVKEEKERLDVAVARAESSIKSLTFVKRVIDDQGRLFGSVSVSEIIDKAEQEGTEILRSEVDLISGPIKTVGTHQITVKVHPEVAFNMDIIVEKGDMESSMSDLINDEAAQNEQDATADESTAAETETSAESTEEQSHSQTEEVTENKTD